MEELITIQAVHRGNAWADGEVYRRSSSRKGIAATSSDVRKSRTGSRAPDSSSVRTDEMSRGNLRGSVAIIGTQESCSGA